MFHVGAMRPKKRDDSGRLGTCWASANPPPNRRDGFVPARETTLCPVAFMPYQ